MKIILIGLNHQVQWKDPSGNLRELVVDLMTKHPIELVAEESTGLPSTVAQRLAYRLEKPWIEIDMSIAERKLACIHEGLQNRVGGPIDPFENKGMRWQYLPKEDGLREEEWSRRILRNSVSLVLCLCGFMHIEPFAEKLEKKGCSVERIDITKTPWFRRLYGMYRIVDEDGTRWCETQPV